MGSRRQAAGKFLGRAYFPILALAIIFMYVQPGMYEGMVQGNVRLTSSGGDFSYFHFAARADAVWYWIWPRSVKYRQLSLELFQEQKKTVEFDLMKHQWSADGAVGPVDEASLRHLLLPDEKVRAKDANLSVQLTAFMTFLDQLAEGTVAGPRHHSCQMPPPLNGRFYHFASGGGYGVFALFAWLLVWPLRLFLLPTWIPVPGVASPRKVFLLTIGIVIAMDAALIAVAFVASPSGITEAMESLLGLVNAPTLILLGDRSVFTPWGYGFGAISWAIVSSAVAGLRRTREGASKTT